MKINFQVAKPSLRISDLLGVGVFEDESFLDTKPSGKRATTVFRVGLGKREKYSLQKARVAAAKFLAQAKSLKRQNPRLDLDSFGGGFSLPETAAALAEGLIFSDYRFDKYKSKKKDSKKPTFEKVELVSRESRRAGDITRALKRAEIVAEAVLFTRNLANEPANVMTPRVLAEAAGRMARQNNLRCRILNKREIAQLKMGGILGVSQGSHEEPRFIILENKVARPVFKEPIVLVGKGVTFDTGGISIKPSSDMDKMKFDMCGAAAVIGAMKAISNLKIPVRVVGLASVVENMPGGGAQRPGDVIRCMNGKTIEVLNTDAEGRLILADALSYAQRYKPKALVDIATLTGACAATFGDLAVGLMGTDAALVERIRRAGEKTGERCWELPLWDEYGDMIRAAYADIQNISKKYAGTITAGMFLKEFAEPTKSWAHLDIAGTAWIESPKPLTAVGATGVGVRLFVELVKSYV